jgi:cell shape-determining protein MreD
MRLSIVFLILAAFLQTTSVPVNLCLIFIICKTLAVPEKENYFLAFMAGITLGFLSSVNLGFWPLIFCTTVFILNLLRKLPLVSNTFIIIPVTLIFTFAVSLLEKSVNGTTWDINLIIASGLLSLPVYFAIKVWDQRFLPSPNIKLKI